jgi:hypothetical protein
MYSIIVFALSLTAIVCGWNHHPTVMLIGALFMGHIITEVLNNHTD